jgi:hypothetical protein
LWGEKTLNFTSRRFRDVPIITVTVGNGQTPFHIHKDLLRGESSLFKATLTKKYKKSSQLTLHLPEGDADTFERFVQWIYSGEYILSGFKTGTATFDSHNQLAELYTLADKLQVYRLKNDIVNKFFDLMIDEPALPPQISTICYIYENSTWNSPLRRLMVDWYTWGFCLQWYNGDDAKATLSECPEFAVDLAIAMAKRVADPYTMSPLVGKAKRYHEKAKDL